MILDFILKNKRFLKYAVSGTINTLITLISYNIFIRWDVNYIVANFIAYCLGVLNGFVLNKRWVFKSNGKIRILLPKFATVNIMSLVFSSMLLFFKEPPSASFRWHKTEIRKSLCVSSYLNYAPLWEAQTMSI